MENLVIKKWVEPYRLLEMVKEYCDLTDYTFDGTNKHIQRAKLFSEIENSENKFGLYMKNVNKYYLFCPKDKINLLDKLSETFDFKENDYSFSHDSEQSLDLIDLGKAEAVFLNI